MEQPTLDFVVCLYLDENYSSNLLISQIRDIPLHSKYELIMGPIIEQLDDVDIDSLVVDQPNAYTDSEPFCYEHFRLLSNWERDGPFFTEQFYQRYSAYYYMADIPKFSVIPSKLNVWERKEFIIEGMCQIGASIIEFGPRKLKFERDFILIAVKSNGYALAYASEELKNDREVVMLAVNRNGLALEYANSNLKNDKEIVLTAVKQSGKALRFASEELREDKQVVLEAVKQDAASRNSNEEDEYCDDCEEGFVTRYISRSLKHELWNECHKIYGDIFLNCELH